MKPKSFWQNNVGTIVLTVLLLMNWVGYPLFIKVIVALIAAYFGFKWTTNAACPNCLLKFIWAVIVVLLVWLDLPTKYYVYMLIFIWVKPLLDRFLPKKKAS